MSETIQKNEQTSNQTSGQIKELVNVLDRLVGVYRLLLDTVRRENSLLVEVDVRELELNNQAKEKSLKKLRKLENERIRIVRVLADDLGLKKEPIRLLDIASALTVDRESEVLRQKHSVLDLLTQRVIEHNRQNESLAQSALKSVTGAIDVIRDGTQDKPTYERRGAMKQQGPAKHLVKREA